MTSTVFSNINNYSKFYQNCQHLTEKHFQELLDSGIDPGIIKLNFSSISGTLPYEYLLYGDKIPRRNDGRIRDHVLNKYRHTEKGGWFGSGIDPQNNYQDMMWGCFKPDKPRLDPSKPGKNKRIKYEHPYKNDTRAFFLKVPDYIWEKIADDYQLPITDDDRNLGFWHWVKINKLGVTYTEGIKKAAALLSIGVIAIGLPGINAGYRNIKDALGENTGDKYLIPDVEFLADGRDINICFDNDSNQETINRVNTAINSFARLLIKKDCKVSVTTWNFPQKGIDDLLVAHGVDVARSVIKSSIKFDSWLVYGYNKLSYIPQITMNQKYLGNINIPDNQKIIAIKAPKGSGKTESLISIVSDATSNGQPVLLLSHRVQLAQTIADRVGIPYVTELRDCEEGSLLGYALCVDSCHPKSKAKFKGENWKNPIVIIDESEQVIWHLLASYTEVKTNRCEVLKQLTQLFKNALAPGNGKIILCDADLSDLSINFVNGLAETRIDPYVVFNDYKDNFYKVYNYDGNKPEKIMNALVNHINDGGKPFICTDGQKTNSTYGTKNLESFLLKKFPNKKILRIDSESIADPNHEAYCCISALNNILLEYDVVIASPSIGTGVSIDICNHFTAVFGCFQGVIPENSARQSLARIRQNVDRHIWSNQHGLGTIGNGSISIKSILSSENKKYKYHIQQLKDAGFSINEDIETNKTALNTYAKMACRINAGMINYRQSVVNGLEQEGHIIINADNDADKEIIEELKITKERNYLEECLAISHTDITNMTQSDYEELKTKKAKTVDDRYREIKFDLQNRYKINVTPDLIVADDQHYYNKLKLDYYLNNNNEFLVMRDCLASENIIKENAVFIPDYNRSQRGSKVKALQNLGIDKLRKFNTNYRSSDHELMTLAKNAKSAKYDIKSILGITIKDKDTPIQILSKLVNLIGYDLVCIGRDGTGKRERIYNIVDTINTDIRTSVHEQWLISDQEKMAKIENVSSEYKTSTLPKYIDNKDDQITAVNHEDTKTATHSEDLIGRICDAVGEVARFLVKHICWDDRAWCENQDNGFIALIPVTELSPI